MKKSTEFTNEQKQEMLENFNKNLKAILSSQGKTLKSFGDELEKLEKLKAIKKNTYFKYTSGQIFPPPSKIRIIAEAAGVTTYDLLSDCKFDEKAHRIGIKYVDEYYEERCRDLEGFEESYPLGDDPDYELFSAPDDVYSYETYPFTALDLEKEIREAGYKKETFANLCGMSEEVLDSYLNNPLSIPRELLKIIFSNLELNLELAVMVRKDSFNIWSSVTRYRGYRNVIELSKIPSYDFSLLCYPSRSWLYILQKLLGKSEEEIKELVAIVAGEKLTKSEREGEQYLFLEDEEKSKLPDDALDRVEKFFEETHIGLELEKDALVRTNEQYQDAINDLKSKNRKLEDENRKLEDGELVRAYRELKRKYDDLLERCRKFTKETFEAHELTVADRYELAEALRKGKPKDILKD